MIGPRHSGAAQDRPTRDNLDRRSGRGKRAGGSGLRGKPSQPAAEQPAGQRGHEEHRPEHVHEEHKRKQHAHVGLELEGGEGPGADADGEGEAREDHRGPHSGERDAQRFLDGMPFPEFLEHGGAEIDAVVHTDAEGTLNRVL